MTYPFDSVLVANRGEIAARILRTVKAKGLRALLVAHAVDGRTPAMALADETMMIAGDTPVAAFLDGDAIVAAARAMGAGAVHRSEERRVGKAGVSTCISRWGPYNEKQTKKR